MKANYILIGVFICGILLISCGWHDKRHVISLADVEKRPPFVATVDVLRSAPFADTNRVSHEFIIIGIKAQSGERLCIGDLTEADAVVGLGRTLQEGKTYQFPKVWLDYKATSLATNNPRGNQ
jgi:hypothetical protein